MYVCISHIRGIFFTKFFFFFFFFFFSFFFSSSPISGQWWAGKWCMHSTVAPEKTRTDQSSGARANERGCGQLCWAGTEGYRTEASSQDRGTQAEKVSLFPNCWLVFYMLSFSVFLICLFVTYLSDWECCMKWATFTSFLFIFSKWSLSWIKVYICTHIVMINIIIMNILDIWIFI